MAAETAPGTQLFTDCAAVFQGGGCRAAAFGGAFAAARERGTNFAEVAGTSAGSIAAVLIAAGAEPEWLNERLAQLDFSKLLEPSASMPRLARLAPHKAKPFLSLTRGVGIYTTRRVGEWVEAALRQLLPEASHPVVLFRDLLLPVSILATDLATGRARVWSDSASPSDSVSKAVRASCAMPFFFEPVDGTLVDGGVLSNLPAHLLMRPVTDRLPILAFCLVADGTREAPNNSLQLGAALADTVVRGAQELQLQLQPVVEVIEINTGTIRATDFRDIGFEEVTKLREAGHGAVSRFFDREGVAALPRPAVTRVHSSAERYDLLAEQFSDVQSTALIATRDTSWVFEVFTALLLARLRGVSVSVLLPSYTGSDARQVYQRRLLRVLGCAMHETAADRELPAEAFVFDASHEREAALVISGGGIVDSSVLRSRDGDERLLAILHHALHELTSSAVDVESRGLSLTSADPADVTEALHRVDQYRTATIGMELVPLKLVDSWARYAHLYKHRQQREAARTLRSAGIQPFGPYWVEMAAANVRSLALPPVVERGNDGRFTVVNGVSRLLLLLREGQKDALCAVVADVPAAPPARPVTQLSRVNVIVGRRGEASHRYPNFQQAGVRSVESAAHTLASLDPALGGSS